jgi:GH18 family chitinase
MNRNKLSIAQYKRHLLIKKQLLEELRQKLNNHEIETARDYLVIANSVFGKKRHQSRFKIIKRLKK